MTAGWHLVLGGSHGIGYAYAKYRAREGGNLVLVARNRRDLGAAKARLLRDGAKAIETFPGDLLDSGFRTRLREELRDHRFHTILVGGPSPPPGTLDELDPGALRAGSEIVLVYPLEFLRWAMGPALVDRGQIILLGSSASEEPCCEHEFFASALLRRSLDLLAGCFEPKLSALRKTVAIWRPTVVFTRLAEKYASKLSRSTHSTDLRSVLAAHFYASVVDSDEYVAGQLHPLGKGRTRS